MTEAEAWREIARRIIEKRWSRQGLCYELDLIPDDIPFDLFGGMRGRIRSYSDSDNLGTFWAPPGTEPEARAMAALWMACDAESEELASK